ncbi:MAG: hypothetical protein GY941_22720 [Planctomycetes bacterium]|nr:hypothetical protein [Planctomycetota bacterium]
MYHISNTVLPSRAGERNFGYVPPSRAKAIEPVDNGTFILPMKQCFMKNRRIMDSTARMVSLLAGWAGQGIAIDTTQGIIAKHIGKSVRQVRRMLLDAWREGYLTYSYTKNRIGLITGIKVFLRFTRILKEKTVKTRRNPVRPLTSDTNRNIYINKRNDSEVGDRLRRMAKNIGLQYQFE